MRLYSVMPKKNESQMYARVRSYNVFAVSLTHLAIKSILLSDLNVMSKQNSYLTHKFSRGH